MKKIVLSLILTIIFMLGVTPIYAYEESNVKVKSLITSTNSIFAQDSNGYVWATGKNDYGQLGLGDTENRLNFERLPDDFKNAKKIALGERHTFIEKADGTVWCVGMNSNGQLGLGNDSSTITWKKLSDDFSNPNKILATRDFTIIEQSNGTVWVTGANSTGQLGLGDTNKRISFVKLPSEFNNPRKIVLARGNGSSNGYTIIEQNDGTVWVTGQNLNGQLGFGDKENRLNFEQMSLEFSNPRKIIVGDEHTIIEQSNGTVWVCGSNFNGQLGKGDSGLGTESSNFLNLLSEFNNPKLITAGSNHTIIQKANSSVWGVGSNQYGSLGLGDTLDKKHFTEIIDANNAENILAKGLFTVIQKERRYISNRLKFIWAVRSR